MKLKYLSNNLNRKNYVFEFPIFFQITNLKYKNLWFKFFSFFEILLNNFNMLLQEKILTQEPVLFNLLKFFDKTFNSLRTFLLEPKFKFTYNFYNYFNKNVKIISKFKFLLSSSFIQQRNIISDLDMPKILFTYLIWKGKRLKARKVFIEFVQFFWSKYKLPAIPIFIHAVLFLEPKIWLKKKKLAGKIYEIPMAISSSWSKRIAVRWLLQSAKKWKRTNIANSLSQEIWDACFKKGGAYTNKENLETIAKWNKAYVQWLN